MPAGCAIMPVCSFWRPIYVLEAAGTPVQHREQAQAGADIAKSWCWTGSQVSHDDRIDEGDPIE